MKSFSTELLLKLIALVTARGVEYTRRVLHKIGVNGFTVVRACDFELAHQLHGLLRSDRDFGRFGKEAEAWDRVQAKAQNGVRWLPWKEFSAHCPSKADLFAKAVGRGKIAVEKKTGCGDWLRSERYSDRDSIVAQYAKKTSLIRWDYDLAGIHIEAPWNEFIAYLDGFKGKPAAAWFSTAVAQRTVAGGNIATIVKMQPLYTGAKCLSKVKVEYLRNCPYNTRRA